MEEAAAKVGLDFIVNVVMNENKEILKVVAGDPVKAHTAGVEFARKVYEVEVEQQEDIVIAAQGVLKTGIYTRQQGGKYKHLWS
ncbi:MAG: hypothetical protein ACOWWO_14350 [Peptococcaceae bacterium]